MKGKLFQFSTGFIILFFMVILATAGCNSSGSSGGGGDEELGNVSGVVTEQYGNPFPGATVALSEPRLIMFSDGTYSDVTDSAGEFLITGVPSGTWNLTITKDGNLLLSLSVSVEPGQTLQIPHEETVVVITTPTPSPSGTGSPTPSPTGTGSPNPSPTSTSTVTPTPSPTSTGAGSLYEWNWMNPTPQGSYQINDIYATDASNMMAVGAYGLVIRSTNGGGTWQVLNTGVNTNYNGVWGYGNRWIAVGEPTADGAVIMYSSDNGTSWTRQTTLGNGGSLPDTILHDVYGNTGNGTNVFVVGELSGAGNTGTVLYSALGTGSDWVNQTSDDTRQGELFGVWVNNLTGDNLRAYAVGAPVDGHASLLLKSGGNQWSQCTLDGGVLPDTYLISVHGDPTAGSILERYRNAISSFLFGRSASREIGGNVFVVGSLNDSGKGTVFYNSSADDDFDDDYSVNLGTDSVIYDVFKIPGGNSAVVCGELSGGNGFVAVTSDNGANWTDLTGEQTGRQDLMAVTARNANTFTLAGGFVFPGMIENGLILSTTDGGTNFSQNLISPNTNKPDGWKHLLCISSSGTTIVAVGESSEIAGGACRSKIYYSNDGGASWALSGAPGVCDNIDLYGVWTANAGNVIAVGDGVAVYSSNSGASFNDLDSAHLTMESNAVHGYLTDASSYTLYVAGPGGKLARKVDNGGNWQEITLPAGDDLVDVRSLGSANSVMTVGAGGTVMKYSGGNWSADSFSSFNTGITGTDALMSLWNEDENNVFIGGSSDNCEAVFYKSTNGGISWSRSIIEDAEGIMDLWGVSANKIFACENLGRVYYYDGSTWTQINSATLPFCNPLTGITGTENGDKLWICGYYELIQKGTRK